MEYQIHSRPSFSTVEISLPVGESVVTEAGAMAWKDPHVKAETAARGGVMQGLKRKLLSGESFFQNTWRAEGEAGSITLAPGACGDIVHTELDGEILLEKGAFLAASEGVKVDSSFQGLKGLFSEGVFVLRCSGEGSLLFNSFGAVQCVEVDGEYVVDNGYAVAWDSSLEYRVTKARKIRSFLFSDQLLLRFSGKGRLWIQSRSPRVFAGWVHPFRPTKKDND